MSSLRRKVIRLAHQKPELRKDLLPVLASSRIRHDREIRKDLERLRATGPAIKRPFEKVLWAVEGALDVVRSPDAWGTGYDAGEEIATYAEYVDRHFKDQLEQQQRERQSLPREVLLYAINALGEAAYKFPDWTAEEELEVAWDLLARLRKKIERR